MKIAKWIDKNDSTVENVVPKNKTAKVKKNVERDTRRFFNQTERNIIWDRQNGRCANPDCRNPVLLRSATHFDHVIPWADGGKTEVKNGQALCANCHEIKKNEDRHKKFASRVILRQESV